MTFCQWLYDLPWIVALEESDNLFPLIESAHVLGITLMAGTLVTVDLRVMGLVLQRESVQRVARALLPYTWVGFGLMTLTGLPLFAAESIKLIDNPAFRLKILLLVIAGANALLFHRTIYRTVASWGERQKPPRAARMLACASALLWFSVIVSGRLIAVFRAH